LLPEGTSSQEAPIVGSDLDRYSTRVNLTASPNDRFKISNNLTLSRTQQNGMNDGTRWAAPMYLGYLLAPTIPLRDPAGQFYGDHKTFFMGGNNPVGAQSGDDTQQWTMIRIIDNLTASYELLEGLTIRTAWSFDLLNFQEFYFRNARYGDGRNIGGFGQETTDNQTNWIGTQTLSYNKTFNESHNFDFLLGYEAQKTENRRVWTYGEQFPPNPNLRTLNNAAQSDPSSSNLSGFAFESFFGRVNYNYQYKYYFSASVRRDGSSRFGSENRYGTFWSVGGSWRLDQEPFLQGSEFIQELKLRSSYGVTGNAGIGNFDHLQQVSFSGIDYNGQPGGAFLEIGNNELTWEENKAFNIGVDFAILNGISGTVEYFNRESENLLLNVPVSRTTGFTSATRNFGAMRNSGVELTLNAAIINAQDVSWSIGGNISFIKNEITKLDEPFLAGDYNRFRREEGRDYNEYYVYGWAGVNPDNGAPLFYTDETETTVSSNINDIERYYIGKSGNPDFFGGITTNFTFKGFSLDAQFTYSWNNWLYDGPAWVVQGDGRFTPRSQTNLVLNRWQNPGDETDVPKFFWGNRTNSNLQGSSRYLLDGTHIRLRNLTLAYNLPSTLMSKVNISSARVYVRGINLLTWTRDPDLYADPEAAINGYINSPVPNLKTISLGVDIGF
jgi:TonB-linked SusC/RagA family outer membrane protein